MGTAFHPQAGILCAPSLQKLGGAVVGPIVHGYDFKLHESLRKEAAQGVIEGWRSVEDG